MMTLGDIFAKMKHEQQRQVTAVPSPVARAPQSTSLLGGVEARTKNLISQMYERKAYYEKVIRDAEEELRQTIVVLQGAQTMLSVVQDAVPQRAEIAEVADDAGMDTVFTAIMRELDGPAQSA